MTAIRGRARRLFLSIHGTTRRFILAIIGVWLLLGLEIGVFYSHAPPAVLVPVVGVCAVLEWMLMTLILMRLEEEPVGFATVLYPLLLLAAMIVGTVTLLMVVFFEAGG
jgi:hypothetical protein